MPIEVINNDAYTIITSGGSDAPDPGTIETFVVASPTAFQTVLAYNNEQMHIVDLTTGGHIKGGEIMLVTDMWATQLTSALTATDSYSILYVDAIPGAMNINDQLVLNNGSGGFDITTLAASASMGAVSLSLWSGVVPTIISSSSNVTTSSSVLTITAPTDLLPGNLLVAILVNSTANNALSAPDDWTLQNTFPLTSLEASVYTRIITTDEPTSYTFTASAANNSGVIFQVQGAINGFVSIYCSSLFTATTTFTTDTPTTTYDNSLAVLVATDIGGDTFTISSGPTIIDSADDSGVSSIYAWQTTIATAGAVPSYTVTPSASDTGATLVLIFTPQQPFVPYYNHPIGSVLADSTTDSANPNWTVVRGAEPMVPAVQGLPFAASAPQTITHNTSWVAVNTITMGAFLEYISYQPNNSFIVESINGSQISAGEFQVYDDLIMEQYSDILWLTEAGSGFVTLIVDSVVGSLYFRGPAWDTGSVDAVTILNGAIGINAAVPTENGTVASAPPASYVLSGIFSSGGGGSGSKGMALVAVNNMDDLSATPSGSWVDYNGTDGGNWELADGFDVALIALDGTGATASWTGSDTAWETLGLSLSTTSTPWLVQDSNGEDLFFVSDGVSTPVFEANTTPGNAVAICCYAFSGTDVSDVVSDMGTFTRVNGVGTGAPPFGLQWWVCADVIGGAQNVTFTTTSGYGCSPVAFEIGGNVTQVNSGGSNTGSSTLPSLTVTAPGGSGSEYTGNFPFNTAWQNPLDYDVLVVVNITTFTAVGEPTISAGVDSVSSPNQTLVVPVVNQLATYCLTFKVPAGYYLLLTNTGVLNGVVTQAWAQPA